MINRIILCWMMIIFSFIPNAFAEPTSIILTPRNSTYTHGEFLNFNISVNEEGKNLTMYIGDYSGKKTKIPALINIKNLETNFIFPFSIDPTIFPEGKYFIFVEYWNLTDSIEFNVVNSDNIVIPIPDRTAIIQELIPWIDQNKEERFVGVIKYLKDKKFIDIPNTVDFKSIEKLNVPEWVKNNAWWWIEGRISDNDLTISLQYLIQKQIITV